jgi:hypothetical protein
VDSKRERDDAARYRAWAKALEGEHPRTAGALIAIAESHEQRAQRDDDAAERDAWVG